MGFLSKFEGRMEDTFEGAADKMFDAPISPVQIAKKAEKQMKREKMVGAGKQFAPTLYTVLVNPDDDQRLFGYYPTLAGETETYLVAKAAEQGLVMDGQPLVRFIVDEGLRHGKFDVIAEAVAAPIVAQLRNEEMQRYGLAGRQGGYGQQGYGSPAAPQIHPGYGAYPQGQPYGAQGGFESYDDYAPENLSNHPLPYVPEDELDYSIDYGEYTFDSRDFNAAGYDEYRDSVPLPGRQPQAQRAAAPQPNGQGRRPSAPFPPQQAGVPMGVPAGAAAAMAADDRGGAQAPTVGFAGGMPQQGNVKARLVDVNTRRPYDLVGAHITLGRESRNTITVPDINASRMHAEMKLQPQGVWVITDLGSTNGTFVNGREVASQPLMNGDQITIGTTNFVFQQA